MSTVEADPKDQSAPGSPANAGTTAAPTGSDANPIAEADAVSTREQRKHVPMYQTPPKVYPKRVRGTFRRIKWVMLSAILSIYYFVPWLRWDRGPGFPDQAVLIDMPARRAYFLWIEIWPQEVYYLTGLLILGAIGLFLATSLLGRVWCGYACPQTVWTDLFMGVERLIEGDRASRIRLDAAPRSLAKTTRKGIKHLTWVLIALATGGAWVFYFNDAPTVFVEIFTGEAGLAVYFFIGLFATTTYLLGGLAREQVCVYMCPWPRFQAAMLDEDSLIVTYQKWRGEPRGKYRKGDDFDSRGDCVDCKQCVAACPTGIDIRDGVQLECINCALCIDACDEVMDKIGRPRGLVTYSTEYNQEALGTGTASPRFRPVRPRTLIYVGVLCLVGIVMLLTLTTRSDVDLNVLHDRNPLFVTLSDGSIRNGFTVKILNKQHDAREFRLTLSGLEAASLRGDADRSESDGLILSAAADKVTSYRVFVKAPRDVLSSGQEDIQFILSDTASDAAVTIDSIFRGPQQ